MGKLKTASEKGKNNNNAVVSMSTPMAKTEVIEKIVEVPVEKIIEVPVEKIIEKVVIQDSTNTIPMTIDIATIEGLAEKLDDMTSTRRQELAQMASMLKTDIKQCTDEAKDLTNAKFDETSDMFESLMSKQHKMEDVHKSALLVLNGQMHLLQKQIEQQVKISLGLGILLLTSIALGLLI